MRLQQAAQQGWGHLAAALLHGPAHLVGCQITVTIGVQTIESLGRARKFAFLQLTVAVVSLEHRWNLLPQRRDPRGGEWDTCRKRGRTGRAANHKAK